MYRLSGKRALVTGAGRGIGKEIALRLAQEGARVAVADLDLEAAGVVSQQIGGTAWQVDVADEASVQAMVQGAVDAAGGLEVLVNCAGISRILPFLETSVELWDRVMAVNLRGTFLCCREGIKAMLASGSAGSVINLSSQSGKQGNTWHAAYCASKFGVIGLTQSIALDLAPHGIRVNAICPGIVWTPMWDEQVKDYAAKRNLRPEQVRPYLESKIPLGRVATGEDVASLAAFLASDESAYLTGQAINMTGGQEMR